ncbi:MAG TPA: glycerate kinase [Spirochaetota bacterium]|nr:glycerate kinase [Spirochaetota bacterium]
MIEEKKIYEDLKSIFLAGLQKVDPYIMVKDHLRLEDETLIVEAEHGRLVFDLREYDKVFVIGAGKATAKMAAALEEVLKERISEGIISVKYGHTEPLERIKIVEAGHPVPDMKSVEAADLVEKLGRKADSHTIVINLISGGGSALLVKPLTYETAHGPVSLTLEEIRLTTEALLSCGAPIEAINCIRKHLSGIKGGRLAQIIHPATGINLILSDVVGDRLDTIASGLTTGDETTYLEALDILKRYEIAKTIPDLVLQSITMGANGELPETPKKGDPVFERTHNILIGTNYLALMGACYQAQRLGYTVLLLSSQITGEAREAAKVLLGIGKDILKHGIPVKRPACIVSGGETTVTLRGNGKGGRNTELALSFFQGLEADQEGTEGIYLLSAATDGNDGPTDAAGAFASSGLLEKLDGLRAEKRSLSIDGYLRNNDSYSFFDAIGAIFKTGPTNTNVCDIQILIVP